METGNDEKLLPCPKCLDWWGLKREPQTVPCIPEYVRCGVCGFAAPLKTWNARHVRTTKKAWTAEERAEFALNAWRSLFTPAQFEAAVRQIANQMTCHVEYDQIIALADMRSVIGVVDSARLDENFSGHHHNGFLMAQGKIREALNALCERIESV